MSKRHRLEGFRRRIARLESRIRCDQIELAGLKAKASRMTADVCSEGVENVDLVRMAHRSENEVMRRD